MPNYFISNFGSDSTGTGTAINPWKTLDKAVGSGKAVGATLSAPTTVHVEPGVYREAVNVQVTPSASAPLLIRGDFDGSAFAAAGKSSPKTGLVEIRAWTDDATPINQPTLEVGGRSDVTIERLKITAGSSIYATLAVQEATRFVIRDCALVGNRTVSSRVVNVLLSAAKGLDMLFERCVIAAHSVDSQYAMYISSNRAVDEYDLGLRIVNCRFDAAFQHVVLDEWNSGSGTKIGRGFTIQNCSFRHSKSTAVLVQSARTGAGAVVVAGCVFDGCRTGLQGVAAGQIVEDANVVNADNPRVNVAAGVASLTNICPAWDFGGPAAGGPARPLMEPSAGSPLLGFMARPAGLSVDLLGRPRPDPCAAGCLERVDPAPAGPEPSATTYIFQVEG